LDVELRLAERCRDLVLDDLHAHPVADRLGTVLERLDAADVQTLGGVELECAAAWLSLGRVVDNDVVYEVRMVALDLEVVAAPLGRALVLWRRRRLAVLP